MERCQWRRHVGAAGAVADVTCWAILDTDVFATWIVHKVVFAAGAKVAALAWVGAVVEVVNVTAAVVNDADATARWLAFDVTIRDAVFGVVGILRLFWLHDRACIAVSCS